MVNFILEHGRTISVLVFIGLDLVTGGVAALYTKSWASKVMREGLYHKAGEVLIFAVAAIADYFLPLVDVAIPFSFTSLVAGYLVIMELGSVLENVKKFSPEAGAVIDKVAEQYKPKN